MTCIWFDLSESDALYGSHDYSVSYSVLLNCRASEKIFSQSEIFDLINRFIEKYLEWNEIHLSVCYDIILILPFFLNQIRVVNFISGVFKFISIHLNESKVNFVGMGFNYRNRVALAFVFYWVLPEKTLLIWFERFLI